jgi:hypothetical protein
MTNYQHGTRECATANELRYKIAHSKGGQQVKFRLLLEAHKKNCDTCKGK